MQYTLSTQPDGVTATLSGRFTFADHQAFRELIGNIEMAPGRCIAVDLDAVEFLDSAALGMLLLANDASEKAGAAFVVRHPRGQVRRTLEITEMAALFSIQD